MQTVQFTSHDVDSTSRDLSIIGITAEILRSETSPMGVVVASYERGRTACKLRDYLESHHCSETREGKIETLPVDGWESLLQAAVLH